MKPIIEVNHVWKEYQKGIDRRYKSLRDSISGISDLIWGNTHEKFWALEDIDFKVEKGESIGIIGRNGAGKSTLLKILSRITPPTKGEVIMRGRVASLLEVGTGFHPELTGRENIFFNGSILGMKHREIKQKFDQIVDFSGVQSFVDTPLKHYSSGMQMRLAFSVAAHLDSEILLIDEVLAVGDAEFQKKCIGKMDEVSKGEGKTILFVSHDLSSLVNFCRVGLIIENGKLTGYNSIENIVSLYLSSKIGNSNIIPKNAPRSGSGDLIFTKFEISNGENHSSNLLKTGDTIIIRAYFNSNNFEFNNLFFAIGIDNIYGQRIGVIRNDLIDKNLTIKPNHSLVQIELQNLSLTPGLYSLTLFCSINGQILDWVKHIAELEILDGNYYNTGNDLPKNIGNTLFNFNMEIC